MAELAQHVLPIIPVRNLVVFPGAVTHISLGREMSLAAVKEATKTEGPVGVLLQTDAAVDQPDPSELYKTGTMANIIRFIDTSSGMHYLVCEGVSRFRVIEYVSREPFLSARVESLEEPEEMSPEIEARANYLKSQVTELTELVPEASPELAHAINQLESPGVLADLVAGFIDIKPADKQLLLETLDISSRLSELQSFVTERLQVLKLSKEIGEQTKEKMDAQQREFLLREQLKTIQQELGEGAMQSDLESLESAIQEAGMPPDADEASRRELNRLRAIPESAAEYSMVRTYLDWLVALPWSKLSDESFDIPSAKRILDEDHFGLEKIKRRILEYLAVRKLNPGGRSPILCFVGPPGVGKTSLGRSIARALGLEFVKTSLGGVHDEAEIRGHRRTYVGAMPGSIVQSLRKADSRNPVFMLDEMDKLGVGYQGDPSAALLEVLDPEQNSAFVDNYIGQPFDLSRVFFIGTANVLDNIRGPLRDRMEVVELAGYTQEEKLEIAKRYLVDRQRVANGLEPGQAELADGLLETVIDGYTREAGVRNLEREIGTIFRHVAMQVLEGVATPICIAPNSIASILGPPRYEREVSLRTSVPGVATGLAWTPVGGDILFIEASVIPGKGQLLLTGQLGDVMKESAQAAMTLVKGRMAILDIEPSKFEGVDVHVHVPAGAVPKDGPSAGAAIFVALVSAITKRRVRSDLAMTGEISLRGLVLPVGGIKEKVLAALRAGITKVALPSRNKKDLDDVPPDARERLEFHWLDTIEDALAVTFASEDSEP